MIHSIIHVNLLFASLTIYFVSAILCLIFREAKPKKISACGGVFAGSLVGLIPAVQVLLTSAVSEQNFGSPIPGLTLVLGIDLLSAFFLVAIFGLSLIVSIYTWDDLKGREELLGSLPFFPLLVAAMSLVTMARDGFLFLIFWEVMSLSSFFLVATEHEIREVRHAGWVYLIAAHLATALLMAFFVLLSREAGSFLFADFKRLGLMTPTLAGTLFVLALTGFGTKAGLFPLHVWLPHAHPAAPSYVSALMSGVMIKTGIYGILRALTFLPSPPPWWGNLFMVLGLLSALLGILNSAVQKDFKRLLAYSSVENIGIIFVGLGLGLFGLSLNNKVLVFLGFGGSLFHLWNHVLFKGALFLSAGQILHLTHSRIINELGGLLKKMPLLGTLVLILSVALSGLPPLNGFFSEVLIYLGLFHGVQTMNGFSLFITITAILALAFTGALTVMATTKLFGMIFLGEGRSQKALDAPKERLTTALGACLLLVILCGLMVLFAGSIWSLLEKMPGEIYPDFKGENIQGPSILLDKLKTIFLVFSAVTFFCCLVYWLLRRRQTVRYVVTWDCGISSPTPRMQYTGSSFAEPLSVFFHILLKPVASFKKIADFFPGRISFAEQTHDIGEDRLFGPLFNSCDALFTRIRNLQKGRIQEYLALIFAALAILLLWEVWVGI